MTSVPYPDYGSPFWASIDSRFISRESLVSKVHALELLESTSPYHHGKEPVFRRIWRAIDSLQAIPDMRKEWLEAALLVFCNVIYLPGALLDDAWRGLFVEFSEKELDWNATGTESGRDVPIHFFENDPTGLTADFFHLNKLQGRLDNQKFVRIEGTEKLADTFLDLLNPLKREAAARLLRTLYSKAYWAILVDKSLSGHSLASDLSRLLTARSFASAVGHRPPKIVILCQVLTEAAKREVERVAKKALNAAESDSAMSIYRAVYLDESCNISSDHTSLICDRSRMLPHLRELCEWFAKTLIEPNALLKRMREKSQDNLEFGYRACGLTLVDQSNCPTDSLPLLWFASDVTSAYQYTGPYVRVHSRIGEQSEEPTADKWKVIAEAPDVMTLTGKALSGIAP